MYTLKDLTHCQTWGQEQVSRATWVLIAMTFLVELLQLLALGGSGFCQ